MPTQKHKKRTVKAWAVVYLRKDKVTHWSNNLSTDQFDIFKYREDAVRAKNAWREAGEDVEVQQITLSLPPRR